MVRVCHTIVQITLTLRNIIHVTDIVEPPTTSLVPRPHLQGGKGSGELGQNPWACAEEFPCANQIAALALSYD